MLGTAPDSMSRSGTRSTPGSTTGSESTGSAGVVGATGGDSAGVGDTAGVPGAGPIWWALIPVLSLGLLTPAPFIHAAVKRKDSGLWAIAAIYGLIWVVLIAVVETNPALGLLPFLFAGIATVHLFILRPRVFASPPAEIARPARIAPASPAARTGLITSPTSTGPNRPITPHFRVIALGVAGSGKTVYLSSMFHTVNVPMPGRSYFLETGASHRVYLSRVFDEVSDTTEPWPRGTRTGETRELDFDCVSFDAGAKHKVFRISYLDYAGELLESEQEAGSTALSDLEERIRNAHGLLGMLDGYRILQYLRNEPAGRRYFRSQLQPMIGIMAAANCPIHFVLTKWDLIRGFGEPDDADENTRLDLVRQALLQTAHLRALVETHSWDNRVIRLIPVSAVGSHFAQIDREGRVLKLPDGEVNPTNVEVPLTAILPDLFQQVESSLDTPTRKGLVEEARIRRGLSDAESQSSLGRFLNMPTGMAVRQRLQDVIGGSSGKEVMGMFLDWMAGVPTEDIRATGKSWQEGRRQTLSIEAARGRVLADFSAELLRLEERLPASRFSGR